ncbi:MAG TPA: hypothetical protein VN112_07075, partial [Ensifer sp.]|nr:hypothetical protein [Ensifer sp.]
MTDKRSQASRRAVAKGNPGQDARGGADASPERLTAQLVRFLKLLPAGGAELCAVPRGGEPAT